MQLYKMTTEQMFPFFSYVISPRTLNKAAHSKVSTVFKNCPDTGDLYDFSLTNTTVNDYNQLHLLLILQIDVVCFCRAVSPLFQVAPGSNTVLSWDWLQLLWALRTNVLHNDADFGHCSIPRGHFKAN